MTSKLTDLVDKYFSKIEIEETLKIPSHYAEVDVPQISLILPKEMLKEYAKLTWVRKEFERFLEEETAFFIEDTNLLDKLRNSDKKPKHEYVNSYGILSRLKAYSAHYKELEDEKIRLTITGFPEDDS